MSFLLVGLGNVGGQYQDTRHNAGFWLVQALAERHNAPLTPNKKFFGKTGRISIDGVDVHLLLPDTLMNLSGKAVAPMVQFYGIDPNALIVAHDELDIGCGAIKLKTGGGHGGHNGLRDIIPHTGADFHRLRIGIGRPAHGTVTNFVLGKADGDERLAINRAIGHAIDHLPLLVKGETEKARSLINSLMPL